VALRQALQKLVDYSALKAAEHLNKLEGYLVQEAAEKTAVLHKLTLLLGLSMT
jgi:hypothetical protein